MNAEATPRRPGLPYTVAVIGAFLIVAALVGAMRRYIQPPPLDQERAAVRAKALAELRATEHDALTKAGWIDQGKGIVRLPIDDAMRMVAQDWGQNPSAARSNLIERVVKATAPPPKAPEKKSEFE